MATVKEALNSLRRATKNNNANYAYSNTFARTNALDLLYKNTPFVEVKEEEAELTSSSVDPDKIVPRIVYGEVFLMHQIVNRGLSSSEIDGEPVDDFMLYYAEGVNVGVPGETDIELLNNIYINGVPVYSIKNTRGNFKDITFYENTANSGINQWSNVPKQARIGGSDPVTGEDLDDSNNVDPFITADLNTAEEGEVLAYSNGKWRPGSVIGISVGDENDFWANTKALQFEGFTVTQPGPDPRLIRIVAPEQQTVDPFPGLTVITDSSARTFPGDGTITTFNNITGIDFIGAIGTSANGKINLDLTSVLDKIEIVGTNGITVTKSNVNGKIRFTIS